MLKIQLTRRMLRCDTCFMGITQEVRELFSLFFEIPRIGKSYNEKAYFGQVTLAVPKNSLNFWYERLNAYEVETERKENQLVFSDPDGLTFALSEVSEEITEQNATRHTDIPRNKQIIRILDVVYHVPDADKAKRFLAGFGVNEVTTRQTLSKEKNAIWKRGD